MKKILAILLALVATTSLWAYDFQHEKLYYNIVDKEKFLVEVAHVCDYGDDKYNKYRHLTSVTVPATIKMFGTTYTVVGIAKKAFCHCTNLRTITLPNTIEYVEFWAFLNTGVYENNSYWSNGILYINNCLIDVRDFVSGKVTIRNGTKAIAEDAFSGCSSLTSVIIPSSVTSIGKNAFSGCSSLKSVTINSNAIANSYKLRSIFGEQVTEYIIGNSVTGIGDEAFGYCNALTSITIGSSVKSIGKLAFRFCSSLNSIVVEGGNTAFDSRENCNAIIETATNTLIAGCRNTIIPNGVKSIGDHAFYNRGSLKSVIIPASVTSIGDSVFYGCESLTSVTIPDGVTSIGDQAFYYCESLTSVTIPVGVTSIGEKMFYNCKSLKSVTIPSSVTSIGEQAFDGCWSLTNITIPASVTSIGKCAFHFCSSLKSVTIQEGVTSIGEAAFSKCSSLKSVTIPESVTSIGHWAFDCCQSLTFITIPEGVTSIGGYAFNGCSSLTSVTIPASVTSIGREAFDYCSSLKSVTINSNEIANSSNLNFIFGEQVTEYIIGNSVTSIGNSAFSGCSKLASITIPSSVKSIGDWAFYNCKSLKSVIIPEGVTSIGEKAFSECSSLKSVTIPNSVTSIGRAAFDYCSSLTNITIPESVKSIGEGVFNSTWLKRLIVLSKHISIPEYRNVIYGDSIINGLVVKGNKVVGVVDSHIISVTIPKGITSIGDNVFEDCYSIKFIIWGAENCTDFSSSIFNESKDKITSFTFGSEVEHIPAYVCSGMYKLTSITIPKSVTSIGNWAFAGCEALQTINYTGTKKQWKGIEDTNLTIDPKKQIVVHCTDGDVKLKGK